MLKGYYNFSGFVVSDWGATHSTSQAINAGLDIDMPDNSWFSQKSIGGEYSWQRLVLCPFLF
jgi:beta-glucosidase-like glycosyl hydrolase